MEPPKKQGRRYEKRMAKLDRKEAEIKQRKTIRDREVELGLRKERKLPATSKLLMGAMIFICLQIIIFSEYAMIETGDMSSLYALIGVAASLAAAIWAYCEKSKAENTKGGIVYEAAMRDAPEPEQPEPTPEPEPAEDGAAG